MHNIPGAFLLHRDHVRDIAPDVLGEDGRMRVLPAAYWATTTREERALFGHTHGLYSYPTTELVEYLKTVIDGHTAIEIGAGHGVLADALGIPGTDNRMQELPRYRHVYEATGQPIVPYGPNIIACDANEAVRTLRPDIVIACWVTHRYDPARHEAGGNEIGVDEEDILRRCPKYILIGNAHTHKDKKIWNQPHTIQHPPWLYSRTVNMAPEFLATWTADPAKRKPGIWLSGQRPPNMTMEDTPPLRFGPEHSSYQVTIPLT